MISKQFRLRLFHKKWMVGILFLLLLVVSTPPQTVVAAANVELYTPYVELSAPPGESLSYSIDLINRTDQTQVIPLKLQTSANDWNYEITAGGKKIHSIAVAPGEKQSLNLLLEVPLKINKGAYAFTLLGANNVSLPLTVHVNEQGAFTSEWTADQANMEGYADTNFTFKTTLRNRTSEEQTYTLAATADNGWSIRFKSGGNNVTSVTVDANATQSIEIEATPPENSKAGTYPITLRASNKTAAAETQVEAVITGSYNIALATADERLNTEITAGATKQLDLIIRNTGTAALEDVSLSSTAPADWEVSFDPATIRTIEPGKSLQVKATIKASKEALPGDYALQLTAGTSQKSSTLAIRAAVKSSVLWGWTGILIIAAVIGLIAYLFRKYGRR